MEAVDENESREEEAVKLCLCCLTATACQGFAFLAEELEGVVEGIGERRRRRGL